MFLILLQLTAVYFSTNQVSSEKELRSVVLTCLYVSYSYMGNEISYPLKPFLVDPEPSGPPSAKDSSGAGAGAGGTRSASAASSAPTEARRTCRERFWTRCVRLVNENSARMLRMNKDPRYFTEVFRDLKTYSTSSSELAETST